MAATRELAAEYEEAGNEVCRSAFPPDFVFGVATSAYQVEGACKEGNRGPSIWDAFSHTDGKIIDGSNGDIAVDQYHRYKEDVELIAKLGFDAYRLSISWSRIFPDGLGSKVNKDGIAYYNNFINALLEKGPKKYLDPIYSGEYPKVMREQLGDRLPIFSEEEKNLLNKSLDFVGLNHYTSRLIAHVGESPEDCDFYKAQKMERIELGKVLISQATSTLARSNGTTEVNVAAWSLEGTKQRIKMVLNKVDLSVSSYDTAWVAMVPSPSSRKEPFFPQCLNWILDNQLHDGSWGPPNLHPLLTKDTLLSTIACILALKRWSVGEEQINKGIYIALAYLWRHVGHIHNSTTVTEADEGAIWHANLST